MLPDLNSVDDEQDVADEKEFYEKMFSNLKDLKDGHCISYGHDQIYNFVDQVVKTINARGADIHGRAFSNSFQAFQDFDLIGAVAVIAGWFRGLVGPHGFESFGHYFCTSGFVGNVWRNKG